MAQNCPLPRNGKNAVFASLENQCFKGPTPSYVQYMYNTCTFTIVHILYNYCTTIVQRPELVRLGHGVLTSKIAPVVKVFFADSKICCNFASAN